MTRENFVKLMTRLRACYQQRVNDRDQWHANLIRYHEELGALDDALLEATFSKAWREFPSWFPNVGELADFASRVAKQRQMSTAKQLPEVSSAPGKLSPDLRKLVDDVKARLS